MRAKSAHIETSCDMEGNFNVGYDPKIPEDIRKELDKFVSWVEKNFYLPVTLWVDYEYRHYLVRRDGKRVGFLFYWSEFTHYPVFDNIKDIPQIRLPVRTEHWTTSEILTSYIEAITLYFAWILNIIGDNYETDENEVSEVLEEYLRSV